MTFNSDYCSLRKVHHELPFAADGPHGAGPYGEIVLVPVCFGMIPTFWGMCVQSIRLVIIGFVTTVLLTSGCSGNFFSGGTSSVTDTCTPEFSDVPIPRDMGIETSYTEVTQAGNLRVGHMRFKGSVEWASLIDACIYNMYTQGWSPSPFISKKAVFL